MVRKGQKRQDMIPLGNLAATIPLYQTYHDTNVFRGAAQCRVRRGDIRREGEGRGVQKQFSNMYDSKAASVVCL